jgi:hypothetical protein
MGFQWRFTSRWRHNFAGSRDVEVTVPGQRRPARAVLVDDAETVVVLKTWLIGQFGLKQAQRRGFGLMWSADPLGRSCGRWSSDLACRS